MNLCLYMVHLKDCLLLGAFASSSIVFSAAYTIYMFNRIAFGGSYSEYFVVNIGDVK